MLRNKANRNPCGKESKEKQVTTKIYHNMNHQLSTSMEAYKMLNPKMRDKHHAKIMSALRLLGSPASMEEIAKKAEMELAQVSRRVVELERETIVAKHGKTLTSKGRPCATYVLVKQATTAYPTIAASNVFVQREMF